MKIVIVGLGEMGASLALGLQKLSHAEIIGVDMNLASLTYAQKEGMITTGSSDLAGVAPTADVILLATPVASIETEIRQLGNLPLKPNVIISDAGSTKRDIMAVAEEVLAPKKITFIGGHAMAGTHLAGVQAGRADLYQDAPYFLIPGDWVAPATVADFKKSLSILQAHFVTMSVTQHDQLMAVISDSPHIIAFALMNSAVAALGNSADFGQYVAGGFKDMTRIAASDARLWTDIIRSNQAAILANLDQFEAELGQFKAALSTESDQDLLALIQTAQTNRQNLLTKREAHD